MLIYNIRYIACVTTTVAEQYCCTRFGLLLLIRFAGGKTTKYRRTRDRHYDDYRICIHIIK